MGHETFNFSSERDFSFSHFPSMGGIISCCGGVLVTRFFCSESGGSTHVLAVDCCAGIDVCCAKSLCFNAICFLKY